MKKFSLLPLAFFLLVGCQGQDAVPTTDQSASSAGIAMSAPSSAAGSVPAYTNQKYGFSFDHPQGWKVWEASEAEAALEVAAWVFSPEAFAILDKCMKDNDPSEWQLKCGQAYANSAMGIYNGVYIDYQNLDEWGKQNYQDYRKVSMGNADVFTYSMPGNPAVKGFHINNPDKKSGVTFLVFSANAPTYTALQQMLATLRFTGSAPQP